MSTFQSSFATHLDMDPNTPAYNKHAYTKGFANPNCKEARAKAINLAMYLTGELLVAWYTKGQTPEGVTLSTENGDMYRTYQS